MSLKTLSVFAATIANYGVCPFTKEEVRFFFYLVQNFGITFEKQFFFELLSIIMIQMISTPLYKLFPT